MADGYTIQHLDELEHPWPKWILVRKSLGITSFGMNAWCRGVDFSYRVDRAEVQAWIAEVSS